MNKNQARQVPASLLADFETLCHAAKRENNTHKRTLDREKILDTLEGNPQHMVALCGVLIESGLKLKYLR